MNTLLYTDFYKVHHNKMYPKGTTLIYSNFTPRKSRIEGVDKIVVFGIQHFIQEYLIARFNANFFYTHITDPSTRQKLKEMMIAEYKRHIAVDTSHIEALWDLGYLPIEIKALPEGSLCPIGVPMFTIKNTHPDFAWLTNYLETLISCQLWQPMTSATIAYQYKNILSKYAIETTGTAEFVQWQGHDFSMRGMSSVESAILSGMAHLAVGFTGTDSIPAIYAAERSYHATGLIGASVPATEHSVMCMGTKDDEIGTFKELLASYPTGILSVVSDTWDLWKVCTEILPAIKDLILGRDGKLVIRPDSGDPVDIICGTRCYANKESFELDIIDREKSKAVHNSKTKGVIELLWETFGGSVNEQGYKVLDSHVGAIYGDSITPQRAIQICERLKAKGFASTNIVLGIGSYTYQYNTRDTAGFAMKATYGEVNGVGREIFKDPITDDGTKRSKKGLLCVQRSENTATEQGQFYVTDQCTWDEEKTGALETVFLNGQQMRTTTLEEIRNRLK